MSAVPDRGGVQWRGGGRCCRGLFPGCGGRGRYRIGRRDCIRCSCPFGKTTVRAVARKRSRGKLSRAPRERCSTAWAGPCQEPLPRENRERRSAQEAEDPRREKEGCKEGCEDGRDGKE